MSNQQTLQGRQSDVPEHPCDGPHPTDLQG